jgi:very-short-patch-repair endonuclease
MADHRYVAYRRRLKPRARAMRSDGTSADSHYSEDGERYDAARTAWLLAQGVRVIRFANPEVMQEFEAVCATILKGLGES